MQACSTNGTRWNDSSSGGRDAHRNRRQGLTPTLRGKNFRVLIVHSSPVTRLGLSTLLDRTGRFLVCAQTDAACAARELLALHQPTFAIVGLMLRGGDGFSLIKDFQKLNPATAVVVLTKRGDALAVQRAFRAGARGYLLMGDDTAEILSALDRVMGGELYASASVARCLLENLADGLMKPNGSRVTSLSDRELQVFSLFGRGFGATRLAAELHLSVKTVETHQMRIKEKLGLQSAAEVSKEAAVWMSDIARGELAAARTHRRPLIGGRAFSG